MNRALVVSPLLPYPPTSGGQKRTLRLLEAMARAELTPQVLTADEPDPAHVAALRARGWEVEVLAFAPGLRDRVAQHVARRPSPYLRPVAELLQRTAAMPAALVQLEHTMSAYYHGLRPGTPTILSLHNLDSELIATGARARRAGSLQWAREHSRALSTAHQERRAFAAADLVLCVSEHDATAVEALGGRALLVPNGVDADFFEIPHGPAPGELATFFGHFGYRPNREGLLRFLRHGWPRVLAARPQARLALAGPGIRAPLRAELERSERVDVHGFVDDLPALLAATTAVVVPLWEGGGTRLKVIETMAAATPVVGTPLGVERIGFEAGRHGLEATAPESLADALCTLLADPQRAAALGEAARAHAQRFRWERVTRPLEVRYREYAARA